MTKQDETYDSVLKARIDTQRNLFGAWSELLRTGTGSMSALLGGRLVLRRAALSQELPPTQFGDGIAKHINY